MNFLILFLLVGLWFPLLSHSQNLPELEAQLSLTAAQLNKLQANLNSQHKAMHNVQSQLQQSGIMLAKAQQYPPGFWQAWAIGQGAGAGAPLIAWLAKHQAKALSTLQQRYQSYFALYQNAADTQQRLLTLQQTIAAQEGRLNRSQRVALATAGIQASTLAQKLALALAEEAPSPTTLLSATLLPTLTIPQPRVAIPSAVKGKAMPQNLWPVSGSVLVGYRQGSGAAADGVVLTAPANAPVVSPLRGKVLYAGAFRQFGGVVIIQGPDGHDELLGGLGVLYTQAGQTIQAGQVIGELAASQRLYWEVRVRNQPRNPLTYRRF
jgi:septal ring factor EnvC (AmiA/AmiB activator)